MLTDGILYSEELLLLVVLFYLLQLLLDVSGVNRVGFRLRLLFDAIIVIIVIVDNRLQPGL